MSAPSALHRLAVHELRPGPAFRRAEHNHRPARPLDGARRGTRRMLNLVNFRYDFIKRTGELEPIEMKDRKNCTIARRIEELVGVPARGERAGFRLAVADDAGDNQIRIVEGRAICMEEGIAEFAPLMDRPRCFRRDMDGNAVWPGELSKQPLQPVSAALDIRIAFGIGPFQVAMRYQPRPAMTGADDIDHVQIVF